MSLLDTVCLEKAVQLLISYIGVILYMEKTIGFIRILVSIVLALLRAIEGTDEISISL